MSDSRGRIPNSTAAGAAGFDDLDVRTLRGRSGSQRWNRLSVGDLIERLACSRPDQEAIVGWAGAFADLSFERLTYRQADVVVNQVANGLLDAGLEPGDTVVMLCDNSVEALLTMLGIAKAGMVAAPLNSMMATDVLAWAIDRVKARFAIVDGDLYERQRMAFEASGLEPGVVIPFDGAPAGPARFHEWIAGQSIEEPDVPIAADDIWALLFTSGTTSYPKAVMISHAYSYIASQAFALSVTRGLRFEDELRLMSFLPIVYHGGFHSGFMPAFFAGGTAVVGRRPDPEGAARAVAREGVTAMWGGSPQMIAEVASAAEAGGHDLHSLTVTMFSWMTVPTSFVLRMKRLTGENFQMVETYGLTECNSSYRFWVDQYPEKVLAGDGTVNHIGRPNPVIAARVVDAEGRELSAQPGVAGEVVMRSPAMTAGYYLDEEATRAAVSGGWFHSGDACLYEEDGQQIMVDRYKDIVKSGGENVSSSRVEHVLVQHAGVARAAVIGLPDERWGEAVTAVIIPTEPGALDAEELIGFCRERLAGFETPKRVIEVGELPETVGGKVLKYKLRQQLLSG